MWRGKSKSKIQKDMCIVSHSILVKYETQNGVVCARVKKKTKQQRREGLWTSEPQERAGKGGNISKASIGIYCSSKFKD